MKNRPHKNPANMSIIKTEWWERILLARRRRRRWRRRKILGMLLSRMRWGEMRRGRNRFYYCYSSPLLRKIFQLFFFSLGRGHPDDGESGRRQVIYINILQLAGAIFPDDRKYFLFFLTVQHSTTASQHEKARDGKESDNERVGFWKRFPSQQ